MKHNIVLKFIWLEKYIGVCLDYKLKSKFIPLSSYYFWPKIDAWEEIKKDLFLFSWVSENDSILILNELTDIINYWQDNTSKNFFELNFVFLKENFPSSFFSGHN